MAPYRSRDEPQARKQAPQAGLVADMVRQFADVHAFVRELVQNGVDAGATAMQVVCDRSPDGVGSVRVSDDGCGMTLDVIENALLVLFRSTKDEDDSKIGKYGVGFMSVFAIAPTEVVVDTWRDGQAHRVRLFPDYSFEIESAGPRAGQGSTVTLSKPLAAEDFADFWTKVAASLHRWCRHAEIPIELLVSDGASEEGPRRARADRPLEVRAVVSARQKWDDMEIVVGPIAGSAELAEWGSGEDVPGPFAGFYNRGLTLHETTEPLLPELSQVRVKVQSRLLCHTLSRDDVRRDRTFLRALSRAKELCATSLRDVAMRQLRAAAAAAGSAGKAEDTRFERLLEAATQPPISLVMKDLRLPLAHPIGGASALGPEAIQAAIGAHLGVSRPVIYSTSERTALTRGLAACGVPVVWGSRALSEAMERATGDRVKVVPVAEECLLVRELDVKETLPGDEALCAGLVQALASEGVERVMLGHVPAGKGLVGALIPGPFTASAAYVVAASVASLTVARWPAGSLLVLAVTSEAVHFARHASSAAVAAHLLARYLRVRGPGLSSRASEALATAALKEIR